MEYINEDNRIAVINENGKAIGEITFVEQPGDIWIADHTYVSDDYRGYGIAKKLVEHLVKRAKAEDKKIIPVCPFVKDEFARVPAYLDVKG